MCPWFVADRWFSLGTLVSSTKKNDRLDITEISLKVALDTIVPNPILTMYMSVLWHTLTRKWVSFMKWKTKDISHSQNNSKIQQEIIEDRVSISTKVYYVRAEDIDVSVYYYRLSIPNMTTAYIPSAIRLDKNTIQLWSITNENKWLV